MKIKSPIYKLHANLSSMADKAGKWLIKQENSKIIGPFSTQAVLNLISRGTLRGGELIARYPGGNWFPISQEPEFYDTLLNAVEADATTVPDLNRFNQETIISPIRAPDLKRPSDDEQVIPPPLVVIPPVIDNSPELPPPPQEPPPSVLETPKKKAPEVINLIDERAIKKTEGDKQRKVIFYVAMAALVLFVYAFLSEDEAVNTSGKIRLILPGKTDEKLTSAEEKDLYKAALSNIVRDSLTSYLEAQNAIVMLAESNPKETKYHELLCLVYKELWPFAFQDNDDIKTINQLGVFSKTINPTSRHGKSCDFVRLLVSGKFQEAKSQADELLSLESEGGENAWIPYWFKTDLLMAEKNFVQAEGYARTLATNWPYLARGHIYLADALNEVNDPNQALVELNKAIKINPEHKVARIYYGLIQFRKFSLADKALGSLTTAFSIEDRAPRLIEAKGLFALAEIFRQKGEKAKALQFAQGAYKANPSDRDVKLLITQLGGASSLSDFRPGKSEMIYLGDHYMRLGDCMSAQAEYKAAFDADNSNAMAATRAAKCLWELNQTLEALEYLKKAIKADGKYLPAYILLADYYSQRYDFESAQRLLNNIKPLAKDSFEVLRGFAQLEQRRNNNQFAINYAKMAEKVYAADSETQIILSKAYLAMMSEDSNNAKEAYKSATRALELDAINPESHITYANALYFVQGTESAISYLEALVSKNPYVPAYRLGLAELLKKEDRFRQAYDAYLQVLSLEERNKRAKIGVGDALQGMGQMDPALSAFLGAATIDPTDPEPLMRAGLLYLETGRFGPAIQQFERVIKINKFYPRAYYFIGKAALLQGNLDSALSAAEMEKKMNPSMADPYLLAAEVYTQMRQFGKCAEQYQAAIKIRPQKAEIYIKVAKCYRLSGSIDVAESMLNIAESKESGHPELYKERGYIFMEQGLNREGVAAFNKYLALSPNATDRAEVVGNIERMGGRVE